MGQTDRLALVFLQSHHELSEHAQRLLLFVLGGVPLPVLEPDLGCIPTIAEAISAVNGPAMTTHAKGVSINSQNASGIPAALALASAADVVVLVLGNDKSQEHEGIDRTDTALPGLQETFAHQVLALKKPTILVLSNGGQVAIDGLVAGPQAIIEAFNPGVVGATALAQTMFGEHNRWGKLV